MPPSAVRVHCALLSVSLLFGANYVFTKRILAEVSPASWAMFRIAAATLLLVPLAYWLCRSRRLPDGRKLLWLGLAAFFGVVLNQVLFTEGMARTTAAHSAVINACIPTWTLLAAVLTRQERLTPRRILAIVLALGGVQYLLGVDRLLFGGGGDAMPGSTVLGNVLTMLNGWSFAVHLVLMRRIGRDLDPWVATAVMFVWSTAMVALYSAPQTSAADWQHATTPPIVWYGLYAVLFSTVLTYLLNTWALRHTHSSKVALYINVQPLVATALGSALGDPLPGHRFLVALVLVSTGLLLQARGT